MHTPYHWADLVSFLRAIKKRYKPTHVVFAGDLRDHHADSYHEQDPDLHNSGAEHRLGVDGLKPLYRLFPVASVLESNHGALPDRKAKTAGLSKAFVRPEKERIAAPARWQWHRELIIETPRGPVLFLHGNKATNNLMLYSLKRGLSVAQGHHHTKFECQWWNNGRVQGFAMTAGCLIDRTSPAFDYAQDYPLKPVLGVVILLDGMPLPLTARLNKRGRWTGEL